jgi:hypothetical protein
MQNNPARVSGVIEETLVNMSLHETISIVGYDITRVVSGWLYRPYTYTQNIRTYEKPVFVPMFYAMA